MYYYILGCGIACLILFGINSMDTVCVKPAEILGKVILWPLALWKQLFVTAPLITTSRPRCKTSRSQVKRQSGGCAFLEGAAAFLFCTLARRMVQ